MSTPSNPLSIRNKNLRKRNYKENIYRIKGMVAILISLAFLVILLGAIITRGYGSFQQHSVTLPIYFDPLVVAKAETPKKLKASKLIKQSLYKHFSAENWDIKDKIHLNRIISRSAQDTVRQAYIDDQTIAGKTLEIPLLTSSIIDMALKGRVSKDTPEIDRKVSDRQFAWLETLENENRITKHFNRYFFTNASSRKPEAAGIMGAIKGSIYTLLICLIVAFPLAVGCAIYLEEFAPKNKFTDIIEVSINNLAAVPSIVFGLLALAIYLNWFHMPRSSSLVGGLALAMLVLPTIVITTRNALKAIPPSIKDAAIGIGASPMQVLFHHLIPLSLPGIMTGTILSIARALGETAPLLMIGMVAFIADVPSSITEPATVLPVQIYLWSDSPEIGFVEKTSGAIMVLLAFLIFANLIAVIIRKKFEKSW